MFNANLLKYTVELLKAIPCGESVRLGVQKPLPYPEAVETSRSLSHNRAPSKSEKKIFKIDLGHKRDSRITKSTYAIKNTLEELSSTPFRKKKKKMMKRRKKHITTSCYDLKSDEESEVFIEDTDKKNRTIELMKSLSRLPDTGKSELEETENSTFLKETSDSQTLSSSENLVLTEYEFEANTSCLDNYKTRQERESYDQEAEEIEYGLVATSAPAILNEPQQQDSATAATTSMNNHAFYSTSSLIKTQTQNLLQMKANSGSNFNNKLQKSMLDFMFSSESTILFDCI